MVKALFQLGRLKAVFQLTVLALVSWGIARVIISARHEFREIGFSPSNLDVGWLMAAAAIYLAGLFPFCVFWHR